MKIHTKEFKEEIKKFGRDVDSKITIGKIELGKEQLNSISPAFEGSLLKSAMKQIIIDSNIPIAKELELNYKFGVKVGNKYEYLDFGNYVIRKVEKQEDTNSYKITAYDKMIYAMKDYEDLGITYPISIRDYINAICTKIGLVFKNKTEEFPNFSRMINGELYLGLGYTYRDVLDELAQVTASTICINKNDELEIRYITDTKDTIDENYLKDINVNFGAKYGPINSIVLSRSAGADNVFVRDEASITKNGLCEIKIKDNQIMNFNDRSDYLNDILTKLNGTQYYLNDFSSTGIAYYDLCDRYTIKIKDQNYSCVMLNDELNVTQGLEENIYTEKPEDSETDYKKSDKTDQKMNQTYLIVDKQNQKIESVIKNEGEQNQKISQIQQTVDELNSKISDIANITISGETSFGTVDLDNINESEPISIKLHPTSTNISYLYPRTNLYPSNTLYSRTRQLIFHNKTDDTDTIFDIPTDLLYLDSNNYDELIFDYDSKTLMVNRKLKYNKKGEIVQLPEMIIENYDFPTIALGNGDYTVYTPGYNDAYIFVRLMAKNIYTTQFATRVEVTSQINQSAEEINLEVSKKVGKTEVVSTINQSAEQITLKGNRVVIESDNFGLTGNGTATMKNAVIDGGEINLKNGASITGDNGLITNLIYPGFTRGSMFNGNGDYIPLGQAGGGPTNDTGINSIVFNFKLPKNFTIKTAKVYLTHAPIDWESSYFNDTGYSRNLNLYKITSTNLKINIEGFYAPYSSSFELIPNAFGGSGFTGNQYGLSNVESIDIKKYISVTGNNQIAVRTSDNFIQDENERFRQTGGVLGYLEIVGFTNFEPSKDTYDYLTLENQYMI